ncbi:MAG: lytic transglycosylase domain-containing protein, partial [Solirubrobacteraceae bacterium]
MSKGPERMGTEPGAARAPDELCPPAAPGRWLRRLAVSMLAGGGVTALGLGGSVSGGALAAEPRIMPPGGGNPAPSGEAPTTTTSSTSTTTVEGSTTASSTTSSSTSSSTSITETTTSSRTRAKAPPAPARPEGAGAERPAVKLPSTRKRNPRTRSGSATGGTHGTPANPTAGKPSSGPSNVAPPPQMVASHANLLAALTKGVAVSAQALDLFYQVPPFLLPIYQAAAVQYGVPWEVLAAINEVETNYGNDQSVSSAGAIGWMQFMPETWLQYGVDALNAGYADPYNPVDAIFAAARYLAASGASKNLRTAVFAYNHSEAYVESVLLRARLLASYPPSAIATLTGLIEGIDPLRGAHVIQSSVNPAAFTPPAPAPGSAASATANAKPAASP